MEVGCESSERKWNHWDPGVRGETADHFIMDDLAASIGRT
jgi:hypothetical protein